MTERGPLRTAALFLLLSVCHPVLPASAEKDRNCPANIVVQKFSVPRSFFIVQGAELSNGVASALQQSLNKHANIMSVAQISSVYARSTAGQTEGSLGGKIADMVAHPDFVINGSVAQVGNSVDINAAVLQLEGGGSRIASFNRRFRGSQYATLDELAESVMSGSLYAQIAAQFAPAIAERFYCVEIDPASAQIDFAEPSEREVTFTASVEDLLGRKVDGSRVSFFNDESQKAEVSEPAPTLQGGKAKTIYRMKKLAAKDILHAQTTAKGGVQTGQTAKIFASEEYVLYYREVQSTRFTGSGRETSGTMDTTLLLYGEVPLTVDRDNGTATGTGTVEAEEVSLNADLTAKQGGFMKGGGRTTGARGTLDARGRISEDGNTVTFSVKGDTLYHSAPANFQSDEDRVNLNFAGYRSSVSAKEIKMELRNGAVYRTGGTPVVIPSEEGSTTVEVREEYLLLSAAAAKKRDPSASGRDAARDWASHPQQAPAPAPSAGGSIGSAESGLTAERSAPAPAPAPADPVAEQRKASIGNIMQRIQSGEEFSEADLDKMEQQLGMNGQE